MPDDIQSETLGEATEIDNTTTGNAEAEAPATVDADPVEAADYRAKWEAARKVNKDLEAKLQAARKAQAEDIEKRVQEALKERESKTAEQLAAEKAQREAQEAVLAEANQRIVRSELKAAAAGRVKRPDLLLKVIDLSAIAVDGNGDPAPDDIAAAIDDFLSEYPELAADHAKFSGSADQGTKGKQAAKRQLTHEDIKSMTPEQIVKAQKEGLLKDVLKGK